MVNFRDNDDAPSGGGSKPVPIGRCKARLREIIALGEQKNKFHKPNDPKSGPEFQFKIVLAWEVFAPDRGDLADYQDDEGDPLVQYFQLTHSLGLKAGLTAQLSSWLGIAPKECRTISLTSLLGKAATLKIVPRDGNKYGKVKDIEPEEGEETPELVGDMLNFSLNPQKFDRAPMKGFPDWILNAIKSSPQYAEIERLEKLNGGVLPKAAPSNGYTVGKENFAKPLEQQQAKAATAKSEFDKALDDEIPF